MGTHASTRVQVGSEVVVNMYRHYDGYTSAHGVELAQFLKDIRLVNGLGADKSTVANGMDDLAAQIIAHFKKESGGFYLSSIGNTEEYDYLVYERDGNIRIKSSSRYDADANFDGTPTEFLEFAGVSA